MLHIVNGDVVGEKLRGKIEGEVLVWREVYSVGPVFRNMDGTDERKIRAAVLERTMGIPYEEYIQSCEYQEHMLRDFNKHDDVVLWFEHDLFDQTMLAYLLHWFAKQPRGRTKLHLLCIGEYPGIEPFRGFGQPHLGAVQFGSHRRPCKTDPNRYFAAPLRQRGIHAALGPPSFSSQRIGHRRANGIRTRKGWSANAQSIVSRSEPKTARIRDGGLRVLGSSAHDG